MKKKVKKGMYWHVHHNVLMEYCWNYDGRAQAIKAIKPKNEIKKRLRWMQPVKGKLPDAVIKARVAYEKARAAYDKWAACEGAEAVAYYASGAYSKAEDACDKALKDNEPAIEELHRKECPNCTWNGKELVF